MVSSDVLGYPPYGGLRRWLTQYWIAIFGATDIGNNDFPTLEDFLRNNADRTYKDAKRLLFSFAPLEIRADLKDASDEEERFEAHEEEYLAEELSKSEIGVHALDKIRRQKEEIESLKSQVATEKKRPKRKPAEKREPKQKPLVDSTVQTPALTPQPPTPKQEIPLSMQFGEDFDRIREMIREDGAKNLEDAKRLIADRSTGLTEADRFELAELLSIAEQGITPSREPERIHAPAKTLAKETQRQKFGRIARESRERGLSFEEHIEAMKRGLTKPEEEEGRPEEPEEERNSIRTGKDIFKKEVDKEEVPRRPEKIRGISGVKRLKATEAAGTARADTASNAAQKLKSHLSEIILYGLREYIQKNNINLPVNNLLLTMLAEELIAIWFQKVREPTNVREAIGQAIVKREGVMLLASGIEYVKDSNTMREMYEIAKAQNPDMPDFDTAVKGVADAILKIK